MSPMTSVTSVSRAPRSTTSMSPVGSGRVALTPTATPGAIVSAITAAIKPKESNAQLQSTEPKEPADVVASQTTARNDVVSMIFGNNVHIADEQGLQANSATPTPAEKDVVSMIFRNTLRIPDEEGLQAKIATPTSPKKDEPSAVGAPEATAGNDVVNMIFGNTLRVADDGALLQLPPTFGDVPRETSDGAQNGTPKFAESGDINRMIFGNCVRVADEVELQFQGETPTFAGNDVINMIFGNTVRTADEQASQARSATPTPAEKEVIDRIFGNSVRFADEEELQATSAAPNPAEQEVINRIFGNSVHFADDQATSAALTPEEKDVVSKIFGNSLRAADEEEMQAKIETPAFGPKHASSLFGRGVAEDEEVQANGVPSSTVIETAALTEIMGVINDHRESQAARNKSLRDSEASLRLSQEEPSARRVSAALRETQFETKDISTLEPHIAEVASRISEYLQDRVKLKAVVVQIFQLVIDETALIRDSIKAEVEEEDDDKDDEELDLTGLYKFVGLIARHMDLPEYAFGKVEDIFEQFDFDHSGTLNLNETYKFVKFFLKAYREDLGADPKSVAIPWKDSLDFDYEVLEGELGHGNFGVAKVARSKDGHEICLKVFNKEKMCDEGVSDLISEFNAMSMLSCERIAGVHALFQDEAFYYMVCDLYKGGDFRFLTSRAEEQGVAHTENWWRKIFSQCIEGLAFMHVQAIMHCDIKENNIMLKHTDYSQPQIVIIDLGVCTSLAKADDGLPHGTPGYVPPETLTERKWFPRGDIFSLGVTFFHMLCGMCPPQSGLFYDGCKTPLEVYKATLSREPVWDRFPEHVPEFQQILAAMLSKDRLERPSAPNLMKDEWVMGVDEADDTVNINFKGSATSRFGVKMGAEHSMATMGITKSITNSLKQSLKGSHHGKCFQTEFTGAARNASDERLEEVLSEMGATSTNGGKDVQLQSIDDSEANAMLENALRLSTIISQTKREMNVQLQPTEELQANLKPEDSFEPSGRQSTEEFQAKMKPKNAFATSGITKDLSRRLKEYLRTSCPCTCTGDRPPPRGIRVGPDYNVDAVRGC